MTTSLHFGPEWMRDKRVSKSRASQDASPPPGQTLANGTSYSSVLTPTNTSLQTLESRDMVYPFRYAKEDILQVWRDGGGRSGLGLEVERWEGIIREAAGEPVGIKELTEGERKLFASVNSDLRRRNSHEPSSGHSSVSLNRPKLGHSSSAQDAYSRERAGPGMNRRKRDSIDYPSQSRKVSLGLGGTDSPLSPRDTLFSSPRSRQASSTQNPVSALENDNLIWGSNRGPTGTFDKRQLLTEQDEGEPLPEHLDRDQAGNRQGSGHSGSIGDSADHPRVHTTSDVDGPPPGLTLDPTNIQWTYIDPTGKVQGPFTSETMQKWHDQGYFHSDLPMRREGVDDEYLPLGHLLSLSPSPSFFMASFPPINYQALSAQAPLFVADRFTNTDSRGQLQASSGVDPYNSAVHSPQDSSALFHSFNGGVITPDSIFQPSYHHHSRNDHWGEAQNFEGLLRNGSPGSLGGRTHSLTGSSPRFASPHAGIIGTGVPPFSPGIGADSPLLTSWSPTNGMHSDLRGNLSRQINPSGSLNIPITNSADLPRDQVSMDLLRVDPRVPSANPQPFDMSNLQPCVIEQPMIYSEQSSPQAIPISNGVSTDLSQGDDSNHVYYSSHPHQLTLHTDTIVGLTTDPLLDRMPSIPISHVVNDISESSHPDGMAHAQASPSPNHPKSAVDRMVTSLDGTQIATDTKPTPSEPVLETATQPDQQAEDLNLPMAVLSMNDSDHKTSNDVLGPSILSEAREIDAVTAVQNRGKIPWALPETTSQHSRVPGFRQIQQSEMMKQEEKKATGRKQKAFPRTSSSGPHGEEVLVGAWGLPTSQAGVRSIREKEAPTPVPSATPGPVWTNVVRPQTDKKSMKEILEEEKKRLSTPRDREATVASPKRAYAESASKENTPKTVTVTNDATPGVWTTIGANGKPSLTSTSRPTSQSNVIGHTSGQSSLSSRIPSGGPTTRATHAPAKVIATKAVEERRYDPSLEFLRWLRDSLKGLNSGVNVDEFVQMLLSFPVDASQDAIDLIQEQAYANSTTIDGRRFAAEFISRRKADAQPQSHEANNSNSKGASLADVVKTPLKAPQSEWGYKVVKKKGKNVKGH